MIEIFGTLGPSCEDKEILKDMIHLGLTGMRLNMSHKSLSESKHIIDLYHQALYECDRQGDLLIDLQGPEVRIGDINDTVLEAGDKISFSDKIENIGIPVSYEVLNLLEKDDEVLIDDGKIAIEMVNHKEGIVTRGGLLKSRKSLKITNKNISGPALTDQDRKNISQIKEYGVTSVMQPFVRNGQDLMILKEELSKHHLDHIRIFAKIENKQGLDNIENITPHCDMIVIARGDLGNDMPLWQLPQAQKDIENICHTYHKPYLVVTQMLDSMIHHPIPTRAEVSDIYHAIYHGATAVMVTNETAIGDYPVEVIKYLVNTVKHVKR